MSLDTESPSVFGADEQHEIEVDVARWVRLARLVLNDERVNERYGADVEMSLMFVDEQTIAELNERFLGSIGPTDVLAFPMDELRPGLVNEEPEEGVLGDLVLCPQVAERQAADARVNGQAGYSTTDEVDLLTVHGILHLLGYDHAEPEEHREMFGLQARLLAEWQGVQSGEDPEK